MASFLTHPIVPLAAAALAGRRLVPLSLVMTGVVFALLPDVDGIGFALGIPYASPFGHRGALHSLLVAAVCAALLVPFARALGAKPLVVFGFLFIAMASHGVLDACTDAGLGVAFLWPWSNERFLFAFHPIEAAPLSARRFFYGRGWEVFQSELVWVWMPLAFIALLGVFFRRRLCASR